MTIKGIVGAWLDAAMPHRQGPQIGKVLRFSSGDVCGAQVRILTPGSLEETDRIIDDVPVPLIWPGPQGKGVYSPLAVDTLVVVGYVEHNSSYPYIQGIWGEFSGLTKIEGLFEGLKKNVGVLQGITSILGGSSIPEPGNGSPSALQAALAAALVGKSVGDFSKLESTVVKGG